MVQMLYSPRKLNDIVAHEAGVKAVLKTIADGIGSRASATLARHRKTGASQITRSRGALDEYVNLDDAGGAAAAIEFGHVAPDGRFVPGIHALTGSLP
jgi:hypothetical protein